MSPRAIRTNYPVRFIGNSVDHQQIKVRAFHDHDIVVISLNDPCLSWIDREELKRIANKKYGPAPMAVRTCR